VGKPTGLVRRQGSANWYYRQRWPKRFAGANTPPEIWISLETANYSAALERLDWARAEALQRFRQIAHAPAPGAIWSRTPRLAPPTDQALPHVTSAKAKSIALTLFRRAMLELDANPLHLADLVGQGSDDADRIRQELDDQIAELRQDIDGRDVVAGTYAAVLRDAGFRADPDSEEGRLLRNYLRRAMLEVAIARRARFEGNYATAISDTLFASVPVDRAANEEPDTTTIGEAGDRYLAVKFAKKKSLKQRTKDRYKAEIRHIVAFLGRDRAISSIRASDCEKLLLAFERLPPNFEAKLTGEMTLAELADRHREGDQALAHATLEKYLRQLVAFLGWASKSDLIAKNYAEGIKPNSDKPMGSMAKLPFERDELVRAFSRPIYTGCRDDRLGFAKEGPNIVRRMRYWGPLIGLFSGLRCGEILQLTPSHFRVSPRGNPFIVLTPDMLLKNGNAEREVPVHPELVKIGLLSWVERRRAVDPHALLFPEVPSHKKDGHRSSKFSKWFTSDLKHLDLGERRAKLTFHSFRHTFKRGLDRADVPEEKKEELCGWAREKKTSRRYGDGLEADVLVASVEAVNFDLSLDHLYAHAAMQD